MTPKQTLINFPEFANAGTRSAPEDAKYAAGFLPADVLPAEWLNYFLHGATKGVTDLNAGIISIEEELINILTAAGVEPALATKNQVVTAIETLITNKTGTLSNLSTTAKNNLVAALNELKTAVDGKSPTAGSSSLTTCSQGTFASAATKTAGSAVGNVPLVGTALGTTNNNIVVTDANGALKPSGTAIGSAAGKIAGSAVGNVPLVGTALGTTDNNIVVTDTAGKLKPSGTTIGSAAGYTAGTAAGNVPIIGTAMGTTNNNIVVTDANGKLKPSGTTVGSAASKTAGSAVGNVPLVGTALGTTNNNILVTDTSGKLKPSGTTLGSAAGKTAGAAAGNVPLVGTALGSTNNNIVVTDTNGALKPSGTTVGSAASKTAGSAAGNVPTVGTALGTTDNNIVTTNTSGGLKPAGITPTQVAYWGNGGGVCSEKASDPPKTVAISGFTLYTGVTVKVLFTNGNSAANPTLNVNSTGAKSIKAVKAGSKIAPPTHSGFWRGAATTGTRTTEAWQPLTTLELLYDGTDWVIMGNPEVENYSDANGGYSVKANGLIEQYQKLSEDKQGDIAFIINFTQTPIVLSTNLRTENSALYYSQLARAKNNQYLNIPTSAKLDWFAFGY